MTADLEGPERRAQAGGGEGDPPLDLVDRGGVAPEGPENRLLVRVEGGGRCAPTAFDRSAPADGEQHVGRIEERLGPVEEEGVAPGRGRIAPRTGQYVHIAVEADGVAGGDTSAPGNGRFHDDDGIGQRGDDPVADREAPRQGLGAVVVLADDQALFPDSFVEAPVPAR